MVERNPKAPNSLKTPEKKQEGVKDLLSEALDHQEMTQGRREALLALVESKIEKKDAILQNTREMRQELVQAIQFNSKESKSAPDDEKLANALARILQEEIIEGEMKVDDLRTLKLNQLLKLEADRPGLLLFAFTTWGKEHQKVDIDHFESYSTPKSGDRFTIDFRENTEAYWKVGADNLLPPAVREITVWPQGNRSKARISKRRVGLKGGSKNPKSGFFDEQGYIPIFNGDIVIVGHPVDAKKNMPSLRKSEGKSQDPVDEKKHKEDEVRVQKDVSENASPESISFEGGLMSPEELQKYQKPDGTWDLEDAIKQYEAAHGAEDEAYLKALWENLKKEEVKGDLSKGHYEVLRQKKVDGRDLNEVFSAPERREWRRYAVEAAQYYANEFGVPVKPAVVFAIIDNESGFNPTIVNQEGLAQGKSPDKLAVGLGQFVPTTWLQFMKENEEVVRRICGRVPWTRGGKLALRTNPELGIWATTWLAAKSAKSLNLGRTPYENTEGGVTEENAYKIYLAHAEGVGGYGKLAPFFEGEMSFEENKNLVENSGRKLERWQTKQHATFIRDYAKKLEQKAGRYAQQVSDSFSPQ